MRTNVDVNNSHANRGYTSKKKYYKFNTRRKVREFITLLLMHCKLIIELFYVSLKYIYIYLFIIISCFSNTDLKE